MAVDSADRDAASVPGLMPAESVTRRDAVITQIKRGIVLGSIKPGQKLTESYLSTALGVSRPTVREALNQVAQEGLLVQEPYRGLRVADLDAATVLVRDNRRERPAAPIHRHPRRAHRGESNCVHRLRPGTNARDRCAQ